MIVDEFISCGALGVEECTNNPISEGDPIFVINSDICTECVCFPLESQCVNVLPCRCNYTGSCS